VDGGFVFVVAPLLKMFGIWSGNMSGGTMLLMMTAVSVTIYLHQKWYEGDQLEVTVGSRDKART
jgi:hypothetical protein